jgi:hypothetical protein
MAAQKSASEQWADLNEIEYKLKLKSDNELSPDNGWTDEQRILATINEVHCRSYRIERRQDILFALLRKQQSGQVVNRILLLAAVALLIYLVLR